jgi:hypothetical protein
LRQSGGFAPSYKQLAQLLVTFGVDVLWQFGMPRRWAPIKIPLENSPKLGEYVSPKNSGQHRFGGSLKRIDRDRPP